MADISRQPGGSKKMNAISYYADYSCMLILIGYTIQHGTGLEYLDAGVKLPSGMDLNTLVISSSKDGETERLKITFPIPPFAVISNLTIIVPRTQSSSCSFGHRKAFAK